MSETFEYDYDVAVAGGGPAGAAAAYHAALLGLKTVLFEKKGYPREKLCGGALSHRTLELLGPRTKAAINCEMDEMRLFGPSFKSFRVTGLPGYMVLRHEFDEAMARDAQDAGTQLWDNCAVKKVTQLPFGGYELGMAGTGAGSPPASTITARYLILAVGLQDNNLTRQLGVPRIKEDDYLAMTMVSETPVNNSMLENQHLQGKTLGLFFGAVPNGYGWCFVKKGFVNIGVGATRKLLASTGARFAYDTFVENLKREGVIPESLELKKALPFPLPYKRTVDQTVFGDALLVGDVAGFVSPVTGEGLYYSIRAGMLAAETVHGNLEKGTPLALYQDRWLEEFGKDFNKQGYFLQKFMYKNRRRMEFSVTLGRHDRKMADLIMKMIVGVYSYRETIVRGLRRLPIALFKVIF